MLANMPTTTTTTGIGNINSLTSIEPGQCIPFNFLKRKLNVEEHQQSEQISNQNSAFQGSTIMGGDGNSWKKRHTDDVIQGTTTSATTAATKTATCFDGNSLQEELMNMNAHKNANINGNNNNNNNANINNQNINNQNNNNNHLIIHNDNNNNNSNTNELQFSLSNSAFINDLFSYDNNLIVPVSISTNSIDQNVTIASSTIPLTTEASNVNAQFVANDDANWQATDLLELDHRYNSTLQVVEEAVVTTTTNDNTMPPSTSSTTPTVMHQLNPTLPTQHQQVQQHFLIPQKQIMRSQQMLNRYRQHYQQQQQQQQHEQHIVLHLQHQPQQPEQQQQQLHQSQQQLQLQSQQHLQQSQQHLQQSQQLHSPQQQQPHHSQHQQSLNYINSPSQQLQQSQQEIMQSQHQQQQHQQQNQQQQQHHQQQQQPQHHQSSDSESDFEDKNLSWLLNFKFDEFPHLSPDIGNSLNRPNIMESNVGTDPEKPPQTRSLKGNANSPASTSSPATSERSRSKSPKTSTSKASKKFEELVMEVTASECDGNDMIIGENVVVEDFSAKTQKKPPFTYTELIEYALEDKGELTVSGIYQWISDRFPFYKSNDDRWKNSVRHNLSINPHFRKGSKALQGAGHLWTISSGDSAENVLAWEHKKQRLELFFKMESMNRERIQEYQQKLQKQQQQQQQQQQQLQQQHNQILSQNSHPEQQHCSTYSPLHQQCQSSGQCLYDEAATAAAAITQEMLQQSTTTTTSISPNTSSLSLGGSSVESGNVRDLRHGFNELHSYNDLMSDEELRKTAGQILNGIHREVEVQSVNSIISTYHDVLLDTDYLNPIHKDVAVNESGLRNTCHNQSTSQYYITEIDPIELGIQMSHQVEEEVLFSDEFNLNYFGYNPSNDIVA